MAPSSLYVVPTSIEIMLLPFKLICGGVVSIISTVRLTETILPSESVTLYCTVYVPTTLVLIKETPLITIWSVRGPSSVSSETAPNSM